jgi:hypothetical protein
VSGCSVAQAGDIRPAPHPPLTPVTRFGGQPKRGSLVSLQIHERAVREILKGLATLEKLLALTLELMNLGPLGDHGDRDSSRVATWFRMSSS